MCTFTPSMTSGSDFTRSRSRMAGSRLTARAAPAVTKAFHSSAVFGSTFQFALIGS